MILFLCSSVPISLRLPRSSSFESFVSFLSWLMTLRFRVSAPNNKKKHLNSSFQRERGSKQFSWEFHTTTCAPTLFVSSQVSTSCWRRRWGVVGNGNTIILWVFILAFLSSLALLSVTTQSTCTQTVSDNQNTHSTFVWKDLWSKKRILNTKTYNSSKISFRT